MYKHGERERERERKREKERERARERERERARERLRERLCFFAWGREGWLGHSGLVFRGLGVQGFRG